MSGATPSQLTLGVRLNDSATFENFYVAAVLPNQQAPANQHVLTALQHQVNGTSEAFVYIWGEQGVGLTHLLQASCHYADAYGKQVQYLPLEELKEIEPKALLAGLEQVDIVCIDNLDAIAGNRLWEEALFNFYNALRDHNKYLLVAATKSPRELPVTLPDLQSRLQWGLTYQVQPLNDEEKLQALIHRAHARGLELSLDVANFIIQRAPRNMATLFDYLTRLDDASLTEKRKLTIPFVKQVLNF